MVETIIQDNLLDFMRVNADVINDILSGLDGEDSE
jgi:hypothetical protein